MLSMGFYPDMKQLQRYLPGAAVGHVLGHLPRPREALAQQFLKDPVFVSLSQGRSRQRSAARGLQGSGHAEEPHPGQDHRDGEPGLGHNLLQHQGRRAFRGLRSAPLRVRRGRDQRRPGQAAARRSWRSCA
jgi:hypothetical protein